MIARKVVCFLFLFFLAHLAQAQTCYKGIKSFPGRTHPFRVSQPGYNIYKITVTGLPKGELLSDAALLKEQQTVTWRFNAEASGDSVFFDDVLRLVNIRIDKDNRALRF